MKKLLILLAMGAIVVPVVVFSETIAPPPSIPHLINYQGMLTDNLGTPLNGAPDITFEIWNAPSGGTKRWWETQSNVPVTNGLFNIILGNVTPINLSFDQDTAYWLQIIVEEDTMPSRLKFTSVAFAYRAQKSDTAAYAISGGSYSHNHDDLYVNDDQRDSIRASSSNPLFSVRNIGSGDGIYVYTPVGDGIYIDSAGDNGVRINDVGSAGVYVYNAHIAGVWVDDIHGHGIYVQNADDDGVNIFNAGRYGLHVMNSVNDGIRVDSVTGDGIQAYGTAGGGELYSLAAANYGLQCHSLADSKTNAGLRVYGFGSITGTWSTGLSTSSGDEPGFMVTSADVELIASGTGNLVDGKAEIAFEQTFQEAISPEIPVKVVLTAQGAPSGLLYVASKSNQGFSVERLEIPNLAIKSNEITFDWIAIGRQKGYEQRPQILMGEEESMAGKLSREEEMGPRN